jgi:hypothetical protein
MTVMACVADVSIIPCATSKTKRAAPSNRKKSLKKILLSWIEQGQLTKGEKRWRELVQCRQIIDLGDLQRVSFAAFHAGHVRIGLVHELGESSRRLGAGDRADKKGQWLRKFAPLVVQSVM